MPPHDEQSPVSDPSARDTVAKASARAQAMVRDGAPQHEILNVLVTAAEFIAGQHAVSSILVLDQEGLLRNGASPNLPADYLDAIDRLKPDPNIGTCAAAAATGRIVITPDFNADDKWSELRHLPTALGFVGAWSMPIKAPDGTILGTFGTYFRNRRRPNAEEIWSIQLLADAAAAAIDRSRPDRKSEH